MLYTNNNGTERVRPPSLITAPKLFASSHRQTRDNQSSLYGHGAFREAFVHMR